MLISALVNFDLASAASSETSSEPVIASSNLLHSGADKHSEKDECACEEHSSVTKFVCGVILALAQPSTLEGPPMLPNTHFSVSQATAFNSILARLERPPQTIL